MADDTGRDWVMGHLLLLSRLRDSVAIQSKPSERMCFKLDLCSVSATAETCEGCQISYLPDTDRSLWNVDLVILFSSANEGNMSDVYR